MNLSLLIHTFNDYKKFWPGCVKSWLPIINSNELNNKVWGHSDIDNFYFGTDVHTGIDSDVHPFTKIYSGSGEWSDRLINLLSNIDCDYVLYCQEDMWPSSFPPNLSEMMKIVSEKQLLRLQLSPIVQFYSLSGSELPLYFHPSSKYLVSHQPSIWNKKFLLSCLEEGEDPWQNEYKGSLRLLNDPNIQNKIAIWPCDWFKHVGIKGELRT